jgi:hypothetical protein
MQIPGTLKSNPFRDFAVDHTAAHVLAGEFECSRCGGQMPSSKCGATPQLFVLPASLLADVADTAGDFCRGCARRINVLGVFGLFLLIGELAIVLADMNKYF